MNNGNKKAIIEIDSDETLDTGSSEMDQRRSRVLGFSYVMSLANVLFVIITLVSYLTQYVWQHLAIMALNIVSSISIIFAITRLRKEKITPAARVILGTVLCYFPLSALFWRGETPFYSVAVFIYVNVLAQLILLREEYKWVITLSLLAAALPFLFDALPLQWIRFDVTKWIFARTLVYILICSCVVLIIWRAIIAYQSHKSIGVRLSVTLALGGLFVAIAMSLASIVVGTISTRNQTLDQLATLAEIKESQVETWLDSIQEDLDVFFLETYERDRAQSLLGGTNTREFRMTIQKTLEQRFNDIIVSTGRYDEIFLVNTEGVIVLSSNRDNIQKNMVRAPFFVNGLRGKYIDPPRFESVMNEMSFVAARPVLGTNGEVLGVVAARVNMHKLGEIISGGEIGQTGVTYLVADNYALLNPIRDISMGESIISSPIDKALKQARLTGVYVDYRGKNVLGVYRWLPSLQVVVVTEVERSEIFLNSLPLLVTNGSVSVIATILGVLLSLRITRGITTRLEDLASVATRIARGERELTVQVTQEDEIGLLARAFNNMTGQLRGLVNDLEGRVQERTSLLAAVAEVSRATTSELDPERLIPQVVNLVYEQFRLYYVGLFLIEEIDEERFAVLRAGTGEAGRKMLAQGWRLKVGGESMIGQCISTGLINIKQTQQQAVPRFENPFLPETRAELALPLRYGPRVIGAMTIQSERETAFDETSITLLQNMADQVAVAIENARLFAETQSALERTTQIQRRYQVQAWREYLSEQTIQGFVRKDGKTIALGQELLPEVKQTLDAGQILVNENGTLTVPIIQSGRTVGALGFEKNDDAQEWTDEYIALIRALAEQLSVAAENQRLLDETQKRAAREQATIEVTEKIRSTLDVDTILQTAVREIGQVMGLENLTIELQDAPSLSGE